LDIGFANVESFSQGWQPSSGQHNSITVAEKRQHNRATNTATSTSN
jgi:hypothetical protein